jgi:hypothetical protein
VPIEYRPTLAATLAATIPSLHDASLEALEQVLLGGDFEGRPQPRGGRARTTPKLGDYVNVRRALRDYHRSP